MQVTGQFVGHVRAKRYNRSKRCQSQWTSTQHGEFLARKSERKYRRLTICYRKPTILLLYFKLICQARRVRILIHYRVAVVSRLCSLFNLIIFGRRCRHPFPINGRLGAGNFSKTTGARNALLANSETQGLMMQNSIRQSFSLP